MMPYPSQAYQGRLGFDRTPVGYGRAQGYLRRESLGDFMRQLNLAEEERFKRMRRGYGEQLAGMRRGIGGQMFGSAVGQFADRFGQAREPMVDTDKVMDQYKRMNKWWQPQQWGRGRAARIAGAQPMLAGGAKTIGRRPRQARPINLGGYLPPLQQYP